MPRDFDMIVHRFPSWDDLHIHFIADVHLGAQKHMIRDWEQFCGGVLDDPNAYIILGGDLRRRHPVGRYREQERAFCIRH